MDTNVQESKGVREAIDAFTNTPDLRHLAGGEWQMFGKPYIVHPEVELLDMLTVKRCHKYCNPECTEHTMSRTEARKLITGNAVYKTQLDADHFVLTNKTGSRSFGFFKIN